MTSIVAAPHAIALALKALQGELGNKEIQFLGENAYSLQHEVLASHLDGDILSGKASIGTSGPVNEFLKRKGFSISLPEPDPTGIACAGVVDIKVEWTDVGKKESIRWESAKLVDGVKLEKFRQFSTDKSEEPVFQLSTKQDFQVFVTSAQGVSIKDNFVDLQVYLQALTSSLTIYYGGYNAVSVPMLNLRQGGELAVFNSLSMLIGDKDFHGSGGKYEVILKLNEKGAVAKAAAAGLMLRSCLMVEEYVFDKPFWFWIVKNGMVYFAARIEADALGNPGEL